MSVNRFARLSLVASAVCVLAACGGGGDGGSTSSSPAPVGNAPVSNAPVVDSPVSNPPVVAGPTLFKLRLNGVAFTSRDTLVKTTSAPTVAAASTRAHAMGVDKDLPELEGAEHDFTNTVREGLLSGLGTSLVDVDGKEVPCKLSKANIEVTNLFTMNYATGDMIATILAPSQVNLITRNEVTKCHVSYEQHDYVITGAGKVIKADELRIYDIKDVLAAHDDAFNTSGSAVLYYNDFMYRTLEVTADTAQLVDLTQANAPILTERGRVVYDGTYLIGQAAFIEGKFYPRDDTTHGSLIVYQRNSAKFGIIWANTSRHYGLFIGTDGKTYLNEGRTGSGDGPEFDGMHTLDPAGLMAGTSNGRGPVFMPPELTMPDGGWDYTSEVALLPEVAPGPIGGRVGEWVIGNNCQPWNMRTGQTAKVMTQPTWTQPNYARVIDGKLLCVSNGSNEFVQHDLITNQASKINLGDKGYMVGKYKMYADRAMVEVLDTQTADRKYVNVDFRTGTVKNLGVISGDSRKVVDLLSAGN
jgi:hypothetical protein